MSPIQCTAVVLACLAFQAGFSGYFAEDILPTLTVNRLSDAESESVAASEEDAGEGDEGPPPDDDGPPCACGARPARCAACGRSQRISPGADNGMVHVSRSEIALAAWRARPEWARRQAINVLRIDASKREAEARRAELADLPMLAESERERAASTRILIAFLEELDGRNRRMP